MPSEPDLSSLSLEERALAHRVRAGDEHAFTALVQQYGNGALQVAYRVLRSRDAASDAVQNTFTTLWRRRAMFDPQKSIKSYIYRAVWNEAIKILRALNDERIAGDSDVHTAINIPAVPDHSIAVLDRATLEHLLNILPERQRVALQLRFLEQMSYAEVGDVLEISSGAAEQLVIRALVRLRGVAER